MFGPLFAHPKIASATSSSVKRAAAWEDESQKKDSAQQIFKMAGNSCSPMYLTYSKMPNFWMVWMKTELDSNWMYVWAAKSWMRKCHMWTGFPHERSSMRETLESSSGDKRSSKIAISCQSNVSRQYPVNESYRNHSIFSAPRFPTTACIQSSFLCQRWDDVSLYIHTVIAYSFQSQHLFKSTL